jgi:hypothetical protein
MTEGSEVEFRISVLNKFFDIRIISDFPPPLAEGD